jgi:tetraacyldisaccharide 4'-kinase
MKLKKPKFWDYKKPHLYSYLLLPLSIILSLLSKIRVKSKLTNPEIKTICIGNIYIGGTGKTSLVIKIKEILEKKISRFASLKNFIQIKLMNKNYSVKMVNYLLQ